MKSERVRIDDWKPAGRTRKPSSSPERIGLDYRLVGLLGTILVHVLILQSLTRGSNSHRMITPTPQDLGVPGIPRSSVQHEPLILVGLPIAPSNDDALIQDIASLASTTFRPMITPARTDLFLSTESREDVAQTVSPSEATVESGDASEREAMFGRYSGQISARIERVWRRPRSAINPSIDPASASGDSTELEQFRCLVRILQDTVGAVQEVQFLQCNGTATWQQSLVEAILAASPLPAPPSPKVFTRALTMTFTADPYTRGSPADGYEIAYSP